MMNIIPIIPPTVSIGLVPTDREWKPGSEIVDEFRVLPGQRFRMGRLRACDL